MPHLLIHSPYNEHASQGNSVTAMRLERILAESGCRVSHSQRDYSGESADMMIALNARKSAKAIARFRYLNPDAGLVIVLTGTDINHPDVIDKSSLTWLSMKLADRLVVLHEASLRQVPEEFHGKTLVIYPSVTIPEGIKHDPVEDEFTAVVVGNMRSEKNPGLAYAAAEKLAGFMRFDHYGEPDPVRTGSINAHGVVTHDEVLVSMAKAHILLNTSLQEGGANAICEAICLGLPVIASAIPGNVGMLGEDYLGYFPSDDLDALVDILKKTAEDQVFYLQLKEQLIARAPLFAYGSESQSWRDLVSELSK